jgi:hypothetical protein
LAQRLISCIRLWLTDIGVVKKTSSGAFFASESGKEYDKFAYN